MTSPRTRPHWFSSWIDAMALFIITISASAILATILFLLGYHTLAPIVSFGGQLLAFPALYLDYRRLVAR